MRGGSIIGDIIQNRLLAERTVQKLKLMGKFRVSRGGINHERFRLDLGACIDLSLVP